MATEPVRPPLNPFAAVAAGDAASYQSQPNGDGPPYRPLSVFPDDARAFIQDLIDRGEVVPIVHGGVPCISYWALDPYLPAGSDPSEWDPAWDSKAS
ncbi:hypothetical protein MKK75_29935 [Methylobacterium sp. J-030]|uniref:hypothetical protein n=1 Tax=Methylobacterium sp. J-030 TaxID=2836627 RepID=UPI001FBBFAAF|nr:hypothetical protein [Methylobacterium sp. J-030]MCJ2072966.1 hypothetical protein [Methylobacterium sp. J-030]